MHVNATKFVPLSDEEGISKGLMEGEQSVREGIDGAL